MKSVVINEPYDIEIIEQEKPKPAKNEALIKIKYCGFCGSDLQVYQGKQPFASYPRIPGHEFSGTIEELNGSSTLKEGMRVTGYPYFNCNDQNEKECYSCARNLLNCCERNETMGVQRDGAFKEYVVMPIDKLVNCDNISLKEAALLEPFGISYHALRRRISVSEGDNILVIGAGPIGMFAFLTAKLNKGNVVINDLMESRLQIAREYGVDKIVNSNKQNLEKVVADYTNGQGMDVCVDAVGLPNTFMKCLENVAFGGEVVLIGNGTDKTEFNHSIIVKKELNIFGSRNSMDVLEEIKKEIEAKDLSIKEMISKVYSYENVKQAFTVLADRKNKFMKVLLEF